MPDRVPDLTHLQFLVLGVLHGGEQPGRVVTGGARPVPRPPDRSRVLSAHGAARTRPPRRRVLRLGDRRGSERDRAALSHHAGWREAVGETRRFYESVGVAALNHRWSDA